MTAAKNQVPIGFSHENFSLVGDESLVEGAENKHLGREVYCGGGGIFLVGAEQIFG